MGSADRIHPAGQTAVTGVAVDARNGDLWLAGW